MKLYAIKRSGYDVPYKMSYKQNIGLYPTLDGCKKAIDYERRVMRGIHNKDYSNEYQILEYDFDFNNYKVINNETKN